MIIYYERYVVIQPGNTKNSEGDPIQKMDFLTEEEYLNIMEQLPIENQFLDDSDPEKFIAKMGAEALHDLLANLNLDELSYELRNKLKGVRQTITREQAQTQEQIVRLAPFQEQFLADIFKSASDLTESGSQMPFSAQQLAGLSQGQRDAITRATQGVGSFQPFLQQGAEAVGQGIGAVGTGLGTIGSAIGQTAQAGFDPNAYQQFMNPFTEDVIAATQADIACLLYTSPSPRDKRQYRMPSSA